MEYVTAILYATVLFYTLLNVLVSILAPLIAQWGGAGSSDREGGGLTRSDGLARRLGGDRGGHWCGIHGEGGIVAGGAPC